MPRSSAGTKKRIKKEPKSRSNLCLSYRNLHHLTSFCWSRYSLLLILQKYDRVTYIFKIFHQYHLYAINTDKDVSTVFHVQTVLISGIINKHLLFLARVQIVGFLTHFRVILFTFLKMHFRIKLLSFFSPKEKNVRGHISCDKNNL